MTIQAHAEPLDGRLPPVTWRWDAETDILSGAFKSGRKGGGFTGTLELTDEHGSVAVVDVQQGVICGLDIVVWPEVQSSSRLAVPAQLTDGRVVLARREQPSVALLELEAPLAVWTDASETVFHLQVGEPRPVDVVRIADHLYVEVDKEAGLAGFWLTGVPAFPEFDEA
ncbi:MAG TPA: hypothetical protein VFS94_06020 [Gemmatimonadales bacterium]|nr:hypothetical protein [Gemmatimonadales bacterium]